MLNENDGKGNAILLFLGRKITKYLTTYLSKLVFDEVYYTIGTDSKKIWLIWARHRYIVTYMSINI